MCEIKLLYCNTINFVEFMLCNVSFDYKAIRSITDIYCWKDYHRHTKYNLYYIFVFVPSSVKSIKYNFGRKPNKVGRLKCKQYKITST